jgi:hypothetical protein
MSRLNRVFAAIDACNSEDPTRDANGPAEWLYGRRMSQMLESYVPGADEALQIAVRGQHIERWRLPRSEYPDGRIGYLRWRTDQKHRHAQKLAELMQNIGYAPEIIARVGSIVRKDRLKADPDAQCLEDVACLVFLQFYAAEFVAKHPEDKVADIVRKTWAKMSPQGQAAALKLDLPPGLGAAIGRALAL